MTALLMLALAATAQAPDSGTFVIRLGRDTTVIERFVHLPNRLVAEAVQRSPTTTVHNLILDFGPGGRVTAAEYSVHRPFDTRPTMRRLIRFAGDSAIVETTQGANTRTDRVLARDAIPIAGPFYTPYELAIRRTVQRSLREPVRLLAGAPVDIRVERIGRDSVTLNNQFGEAMRAHIDAQGRILHLRTPAYTTVERTGWVPLDQYIRQFAQRDSVGKGLGPLSPRAASRTRVGQANVWLDYSRPAARGRPIWGALVPWGQVWRMGANDAAHIATDRTLQIGDITVQPGTYTLFLLPNQDRWELIVNRRTGMSGLDYDPAQDVGRTQMRVGTATSPFESFLLDIFETGGETMLRVGWDRTLATVPVRVR